MDEQNDTKKQRDSLENDRRNSLARYLIHCRPERQRMFLKHMKRDEMREDIKERMREALAKEIAAMPENMRNLRLSRLQERCNWKEFDDPRFFTDILSRVKRHLKRIKGNE